MTLRLPKRTTVLSLLAASIGLIAACGGRSRTVIDDDDTVPRAGGSSAGAPSAGAPSAGAPSAGKGGANTGHAGAPAGGCGSVGCVTIGCGTGTHLEMLAGACCPVCVDDPVTGACEMGKQAYAQMREQLTEKYQYGCNQDSECVQVAPFNRCETGCQYTPVWTGAEEFFTQNLGNAADTYCSTCMVGPIPPCAAPQVANCVDHRCVVLSLK